MKHSIGVGAAQITKCILGGSNPPQKHSENALHSGLEFSPSLSMKSKTPGKIMSLGGEAPGKLPAQNRPQNRHSNKLCNAF
jgi:hypothetical protein